MVLLQTSCKGPVGRCPVHVKLGKQNAFALPSRRSKPFAVAGRATRPDRAHHLFVSSIASVEKPAETSDAPSVSIDNKRDNKYSAVSVTAPARSNLLGQITDVLTSLGLEIAKATVDNSNGTSVNKFYVARTDGRKLESKQELEAVQSALESAVSPQSVSLKRPVLKTADKSVGDDKKDFLYSLMGNAVCRACR